jgi:hypothetical protein
VDVSAIESAYKMPRATIPDRNATLDWAYGDVREVLAVGQYTAEQTQLYCLNRNGGLYAARMDDAACRDSDWPYPQGYPNYFSPLDVSLQMLGSYGVTGDLTVPGVNEYGTEVRISLVRPPGGASDGPAVRYCSPMPPPAVYALPTGAGVTDYIVGNRATCSARRALVVGSGPEGGGSGPEGGADLEVQVSGTHKHRHFN